MKVRRQTSGFPRVNCLVEGCRRGTTRIEPYEEGAVGVETNEPRPSWICGVHWRRVPRRLKRRRSFLLRRWRKLNPTRAYWHLPPGSPQRLKTIQAERLLVENWRRIKAVFDEGCIDRGEIERLFGT